MQRLGRFALVPLLLSTSVLAVACGGPEPEVAGARDRAGPVLPLRVLRLYETGVGYFERSGELEGRARTTLPVPAGHLDDALKSLVVLDGGAGGRVDGLSFPSSVTRATARARAGLPTDADRPITFRDLLVSMKGERVVVTSTRAGHAETSGRVVEVTEELDEHATVATRGAGPAPKDGAQDVKRLTVTLLTDRGEVRTLPASEIAGVHPIDPAFARRLDAALDALSTRSAQNARALALLGQTQGRVTFGYITETPIWRASYRLVGAADGKSVLQGWALVHNDTDEPWRGVRVELVNGQPDSFLFPLAAPRYARRTLAHPEDPLATLPQLQGTTADAMWGDHLDAEAGSGTGSGYGYGSGHGRLGGAHVARAPSIRAGAATVSETGSSVLSVGNLAEVASAKGVENGALFVYALPGAFSLEAHASALVPFTSKPVTTEPLAYFSSPTANARSALRFVNTTGQTLPAGTLAVFGSAGFSGETALDRLKPGERRILQVGNDLDAELTPKASTRKEEPKRLTWTGERLEVHFFATTDLTWELENRSASARTFVVELDANANGKIVGTDRVDVDEATSHPLALFDVPPRAKKARSFTVTEGLSRSYDVDALTPKLVTDLLAKTSIAQADLAVLAQADPLLRALAAEHTKVEAAQKETARVEADLARFREHLKALGGGDKGGSAAAPIVKRVLDAEDRLEGARKSKETATEERDRKRDAVRAALSKLGPR